MICTYMETGVVHGNSTADCMLQRTERESYITRFDYLTVQDCGKIVCLITHMKKQKLSLL
jgi:hypothetical protein